MMDKDETALEPSKEVRHWMDEISSAKKREKEYRKTGTEVIDIYSGKKSEVIPFNILFSNVETLLPALFSQSPRPVVKRRFDDQDPIGMAASKAGERMLKYLLDTNVEGFETFEESMSNATLDALLPGRGVTSIKYDAEVTDVAYSEEDTETTPVVQWEQVCTDSRGWDKVFFGYAKKWSKVPWIAYEDYLDKEECERLFGEDVAAKIVFTEGEEDDDDENRKSKSEDNKGSRKTAVVYQIWDKTGDKKIRYISPAYNDGYLKVQDDELGITGFFNCPRPIQFIKKSNDLMPVSMYTLYENQAKELNTITIRIGTVVKAIQAKGLYDGALGDDIGALIDSAENVLTPTDKGSSLIDGGLAKAIWFMPVEQLIVVLQQLLNAREACKRTIYEITGISDILRGQSMASETLGAQQIKESWGTLRLKRLQIEVQRYARDILRIMLEVAASKMSEETWAKATGLPFPTAQQKQQAQQIMQAMQQMPGQPPQQPDPKIAQAAQMPSWEEIIGVLKDDMLRSYKIDIETNSTIDVEATEDQKNVADFMNAMGQLMAGLTPMVESQALPFEAAQAIMLAVVRKYRFGTEVEEQFMNMKAPQKANPEAEKAKADMAQAQQDAQVEMQKMQMESQQNQMQLQSDNQQAMAQLKADMQVEQAKLQAQSTIDAAKLQAQRSIEQMKAQIDRDTELKKAELQAETQIKIARINAKATLGKFEEDPMESDMPMTEHLGMVMSKSDDMMRKSEETDTVMRQMMQIQAHILELLNAPKPEVDVIRDGRGKVIKLVPKQA